MGTRFRKSKKVGPLRVTVSKSGISTSVGGKAGRITTSTSGRTTLTTRIPGSGISNVSTIGGGKSSRSSKKQADVWYKIQGQQYVQSFNNTNDATINIGAKAITVRSAQDISSELESLTPEKYVKEEFNLAPPEKEKMRKQLEIEAQQFVSSLAFWSAKKRRAQYISDHLEQRYSRAYNDWQERKTAFETTQAEIERERNQDFFKVYEQKRQYLKNVLAGTPTFIEQELDDLLGHINMQLEFSVHYDYNAEQTSLYVDLDLPEIEDLPDEIATQLASGATKVKKKTQTALRQDYAQCVFGLAVYLASEFYNISVVIETILISAYTQRRDKEGNLRDDYIYSIIFDRSQFEHQDLSHKDPIDFCMSFENRCNLSKTNIFKAIKPFEPDQVFKLNAE